MIQPSVPGERVCLRCNKTFRSPDRIRIRVCPGCHNNKKPVFVPRFVQHRYHQADRQQEEK